jgi:preprotein translocase subunit SecY
LKLDEQFARHDIPKIVQMDMIVKGTSPGEPTRRRLADALLFLRLVGALCLFTLYTGSLLVDGWLLHVAYVRVSVAELLILVGFLSQAAHVVRLDRHLAFRMLDPSLNPFPHGWG